MHSYTLHELNEYIKRVIALNFDEALWIECEISNVNEVRGQVYLDLVEKTENSTDVIAQTSAVIWYKANLFIKNKLKDLYDSILAPGMKIKCKVIVEFHERYGLKLNIEDVDVSYTLGNLEIERQRILESLRNKGLLELNKLKTLPQVLQSLAIISSETAAGYKDFTAQLDKNPYGYMYHIELYPAAMQGLKTETEVVTALKAIKESHKNYDAIVIIRGGGSKLDLSFFDNFAIAQAIAQADIPVLTGIGHEIDISVADIVAYSNFKTPTAVANFIIDSSLNYEGRNIDIVNQILSASQVKITAGSEKLFTASQMLSYLSQKAIYTKEKQLSMAEKAMENAVSKLLNTKAQTLASYSQLLQSYNPQEVLKRGYALVKQKGKVVSRAKKLDTKSPITLAFFDGEQNVG